jgi:hypothetical protein
MLFLFNVFFYIKQVFEQQNLTLFNKKTCMYIYLKYNIYKKKHEDNLVAIYIKYYTGK